MTIFSGGTVDSSILPAQTGLDLGNPTQRWDGFFQQVSISSDLNNPALPPLDGAGRARFNLPVVFNATFEEGGTAAPGDAQSGWAEYLTFSGGTFGLSASPAYSGNRSVKIHGIAGHAQALINRARFSVTVGDTISVRGAYYTSGGAVLAYSRVSFFDKNDVFVDGAYVVNGGASVGAWTYASGSKVVPAGSVYAAWELGYHGNSTTDGDCFFDALWVADRTPADLLAVVPSGLIMLSLSACPTGYTEVTALSGKFVLGTLNASGDVGTIGGANNITPAGSVSAPTFTGNAVNSSAVSAGTPSGTVGASVGTALVDQNTLDIAVASTAHTHTFAGSALGTHQHATTATGSNSAPAFTGTQFDNRPAFIKVIFCSKD